MNNSNDSFNMILSHSNNEISAPPGSISINGCDFLLENKIPIMTRLTISLDLSTYKIDGIKLSPIDKHITFEGTVVRNEEKVINNQIFYHTAIFFGELPKRIIDILKTLIESNNNELSNKKSIHKKDIK